MVVSDQSQYCIIPFRREVDARLSRMETTIDGIWVCFLIILLLGLADQDGGKKGRRVGFYWCSRRPSLLLLPLYPRGFSFYISILLHGSVLGVSGFDYLCCVGHLAMFIPRQFARSYIHLFGDSNTFLSRAV